jgi:hypothetical protein
VLSIKVPKSARAWSINQATASPDLTGSKKVQTANITTLIQKMTLVAVRSVDSNRMRAAAILSTKARNRKKTIMKKKKR